MTGDIRKVSVCAALGLAAICGMLPVARCSKQTNEPTNHAPFFTPDTLSPIDAVDLSDSAVVGREYRDTVYAFDPDGDSLVFGFLIAPQNMSFTAGIMRWKPQEEDIGTALGILVTSDLRDGYDTLSWTIAVSDTNHPPRFLTDDLFPDTLITGHHYADSFTVFDRDGDSLSISLVQTPDSLDLDATVLRWTPADSGRTGVTLTVTDPYGAADTLVIVKRVILNAVPVIDTALSGLHDTLRVGFVYRWKDDDYRLVDGCGHTLSHDGALALESPSFLVGSPVCTPRGHEGFAITPFRRVSDAPVNLYTEHYDVYGISLNWGPYEYRVDPAVDPGWWGWYFGNRNDYVIGRLQKAGSSGNGVWMIDWAASSWTRLTPADSLILVNEPAVYFGDIDFDSSETGSDTDTTVVDPFDPHYRVVRPNGGELFRTGDPCTVQVTADRSSSARISLLLRGGDDEFMLPGLTASVDPLADSMFYFTIPDTFYRYDYNSGTGGYDTVAVSPVSDSCAIRLEDYNATAGYADLSDGFFRIIAR